ncbi:MAG: hypothetical protein ACI9XB_002753, partial [Gammaproteobacteria bacterium]
MVFVNLFVNEITKTIQKIDYEITCTFYFVIVAFWFSLQ